MYSNDEKSTDKSAFFPAIGKGTIFGLVLSIGLILLVSLLFTLTDIPEGFTDVLVYACAAAGALLSGFICSKKLRSKGLICGIMAGAILFIILLLTGLIVFGGVNFASKVPIMLLVTLIPGAIGGILGVNA